MRNGRDPLEISYAGTADPDAGAALADELEADLQPRAGVSSPNVGRRLESDRRRCRLKSRRDSDLEATGGSGAFEGAADGAPRRRSELRRVIAVALLVGVVAFVGHTALAVRFDATGAFDQYNVFFNADVHTRIEAFAEGRHLGVKHPNLMPMTTPLSRLGAAVLTGAGVTDAPAVEVRRALALLVVPAASGAKAAVAFATFVALGATVARSLLLTAVATLAFSNVVFGTIPESYGLTGLCIALASALAATSSSPRSTTRWWHWVALGVVAMGITVVNAAWIAIFFACAEIGSGRRTARTGSRLALFVVTVGVLTAGSSWLLERALVSTPTAGGPARVAQREAAIGAERATPPVERRRLLDRALAPLRVNARGYLQRGQLDRVLDFPLRLPATFAPTAIGTVPNPLAAREGSRYRIEFVIDDGPVAEVTGAFVAFVLLAALTAATVVAARRHGRSRAIACASVALLAASALVSFYGPNPYLYSQNWQLAAWLPIAAAMAPVRRYRTAVDLGLAAAAVALFANDVRLVSDMLGTLAAQP
jgi:hypothetical protein